MISGAILAGSAAAIAAGVGAYAYMSDPVAHSGPIIAPNTSGHTPETTNTLFQQYKIEKRNRYTRVTSPRAEDRNLPVTGPIHALVVPRNAPFGKATSQANRVALATNWREAMALAERHDEDWRCGLFLFCNETGWDKYHWGFNVGSRKAHPQILAGDGTAAQGIYTSNARATGCIIFRDGYGSVDLYYTFPDLPTGLREEKDWFNRNANLYAEVLPAYRRGGVDGLIAARRTMVQHGYTGRPGNLWLPTDEGECRGFWRGMLAACGPTLWAR